MKGVASQNPMKKQEKKREKKTKTVRDGNQKGGIKTQQCSRLLVGTNGVFLYFLMQGF